MGAARAREVEQAKIAKVVVIMRMITLHKIQYKGEGEMVKRVTEKIKNLVSEIMGFKFLWDEKIDISLSDEEIKKRFSEIPQYIIEQRDKHVGTVKIISPILLATNSSVMLFLLNSQKASHISFYWFLVGLFMSMMSLVIVYGFYCDTYKSTIYFAIGRHKFKDFIQYECMINRKFMKAELVSMILSVFCFSMGINGYM